MANRPNSAATSFCHESNRLRGQLGLDLYCLCSLPINDDVDGGFRYCRGWILMGDLVCASIFAMVGEALNVAMLNVTLKGMACLCA